MKNYFNDAQLLIRQAFESCYGANQVGRYAKSLGFEALNIKLKTSRIGAQVAAFGAIANEAVELTKDFEKRTEEYLSVTTQFVELLLSFLKQARVDGYLVKSERLGKQQFDMSENSLWNANRSWFQSTHDVVQKRIEECKDNTKTVYFKLRGICNHLYSMVSNEKYALNLAKIEASREVDKMESILPSLETILSLLTRIIAKIDQIRVGLDGVESLLDAGMGVRQ